MVETGLFEKASKAQSNVLKEQEEIKKHIDKMAKARCIRDHYNDLIVANSQFYESLIGKAITELITTIEGREFIYKDAILFYMEPIKNGEKGNIIIDRGMYNHFHYSDDVDYKPKTETLIQKGFAVYLNTHFGFRKLPVFYVSEDQIKFNDTDIKINLDSFGYVEDFFKALVQYCCEREITDATEKEVNACLTEFLENYKREHAPKNPTKTLGNKTQ